MRNPIPVIAVLFSALSGAAQTGSGFEVLLRKATIYPERNITDSSLARIQQRQSAARSLLVIQFDRPLAPADKASLRNSGIEVLDYIPNNAYLVTVSGTLTSQELFQYGARSVIELSAEQKMDERLWAGNFPSWAVSEPGTVDVWVSYPASFNASEVTAALQREQFTVLSDELARHRILSLRVPVTRLGELALLGMIEFVQPVPPPPVNLSYSSTWVSRANILKAPVSAGGRGLTGDGVVVGVGDDGDIQTHLDFRGRMINRTGAWPANHATHVAGTVGGAGLVNEYYEGYAPGVTLIPQVYSRIITNAETYVQDHGMVVTNNSYGFVVQDCPFNGLYDLHARMIDELAIDLPELTHVVAAGNDGSRTCAPYAQGFHTVLGGYQSAKNVITVGASTYTGLIGGLSSRGPVKDGRIKPEILAQGIFLPSTWTYNQYSYNNGTSMAAPGVSGGLALLIEQYRGENGSANPTAALMKALLVNSGNDGGNAGPDFRYGFGNVDFNRASQMLTNNRFLSSGIAQGNTNTHNINVPAGTAFLKVTLYWPDPPASILASKTLVNDLDLQVESPGGTVLPLVLDTAALNLNLAATTGADHTNNIEQVVIANPDPGSHDIRVTGTLIAQNPAQDYVVVYDFIPNGLRLTNPVGGERMLESVIAGLDLLNIQWESYGTTESGFTLEYFDGSSWNLISNAISGTARLYEWDIPSNLSTNAARIRITGNSSAAQSTSEPFVITPTISLSLAGVQCPGYINLSWNSIVGVSDYEVMKLQGNEWTAVATTSQLSYVFSGLSPDSIYWVTVRPLVNGTPGRRAIAASRQPNNGACTGSISDDDLALTALLSPGRTGRLSTSTALSNSETITVRITNLDDEPVSGSMDISYSVNGTTVQTTTINPNIPAGGTYDHSFGIPSDLSAPGTYVIEASLVYGADPVVANNSLEKTIRQLDNPPITSAALPWLDDLETMPLQEIVGTSVGLNGGDRYDFNSDKPDTGRIRSFVNSGIAYSGSRALTLDARIGNFGTTDSLTATFNLGSFTTADDIRVDFRYKNHGQDSAHAANRVWIRGSDAENWIEVYDLFANQPDNDGSFKLIGSVQINDSLAAHSQDYSTSFQLRIGQWGWLMAADNVSGNGYTIDDFRIYRAVDDIQLLAIDTPVVLACGLNSTVPVKAIVLNTSPSTISNIPIVLRVDGIIVATESIPSIPGNDTVHYTFNPGVANLQAVGDHLVEVWVDLSTDNVPDNDTASVVAKHLRLVNSFPYLEDFESSDGSWHTLAGSGGRWQYGTPSSAKINRAASGTRAWKTNLYGYYGNRDSAFLYSPCFDLSSMTAPALSFSLALDLEDCGGGGFCDGAWVDISTDGGASWTRLGAVGQGTNWYNRNYAEGPVWSFDDYHRWHVATIPLPASNNNNVRFRFGYEADPSVTGDGIAIDDIHVYDNVYGIWTGTGESAASVQPSVNGSGWIDFIVDNQLIASVNPAGLDLGSTEAKAFVNTGGVRINKQQYYHDRNITIKPANVNLADSAIVRFYFLDTETEALINASGCASCYKPQMAYDLGVTKYSDPDDSWENGTLADNHSGSYLFINAQKAVKVPFDKGYYAEFKVKDFSEFWLNNGGFDNNTPLPAELLSFTAIKQGRDVQLKWTTASEQDVLRFEIELARGNEMLAANQFVRLGELPSQGNAVTEQFYQFLDTELNKRGIRYYRLKIVDMDGSISYSPVRPVWFDDEFTWQVYPVPSNGQVFLEFQASPGERIQCRVIQQDGRTVREFEVKATGFTQKVNVDISQPGYPSGLYLLETNVNGKKRVFRIIKQ